MRQQIATVAFSKLAPKSRKQESQDVPLRPQASKLVAPIGPLPTDVQAQYQERRSAESRYCGRVPIVERSIRFRPLLLNRHIAQKTVEAAQHNHACPFRNSDTMFGVSGTGLAAFKTWQNEGKRPRYSLDQWDKTSVDLDTNELEVMERDRRLTGTLRGQTDNPEAPLGFEFSNGWKLEKRFT
ncbi:hypothetical protein CFAM422_008045 [Trichoderma lentiforme]|uniref:NADH dehydrogenase [ubiquinone] 1 alpha subcomplex subunit 1 n=1 Tax=Trichoderma lentiforme TaxID=1567552 RepID=A0A9P4XCF1_9HYPO|nr:hypothetical protein CFAM422_008045 [Trichoderma lentiforme]